MATANELKTQLLKLYRKQLEYATYEYLHGEEVREMCEADPEGNVADVEAEGCEKQDAELMKEFETLVEALCTAEKS